MTHTPHPLAESLSRLSSRITRSARASDEARQPHLTTSPTGTSQRLEELLSEFEARHLALAEDRKPITNPIIATVNEPPGGRLVSENTRALGVTAPRAHAQQTRASERQPAPAMFGLRAETSPAQRSAQAGAWRGCPQVVSEMSEKLPLPGYLLLHLQMLTGQLCARHWVSCSGRSPRGTQASGQHAEREDVPPRRSRATERAGERKEGRGGPSVLTTRRSERMRGDSRHPRPLMGHPAVQAAAGPTR